MPDLHIRNQRPPLGAAREDRRDEQPGLTYANYLYIRYDNTIGDGRLPDGSVPSDKLNDYFFSPDITFHPTDTLGNPVVGTEVAIEALIFNDGFADAVAVEVEFWWFNPAFALTAANGTRLWDGTHTTLVSVPHDDYLRVPCPVKWQPQFVNGGHECLVVLCRCPGEGTNGLNESDRFIAHVERHVGQRNLMVSPAGTPLKLQLRAPNPFSAAADFTIRLTSALVGVDIDALSGLTAQDVTALVGNAVAGRQPVTPGGRPLAFEVTDVTDRDFGVAIRQVEKTPTERQTNGNDLGGFLLARGKSAPDVNAQSFGRILGEFSLGPRDMAVLDIAAAPADMGAGHFLVHKLSQVAEGAPVGGYAAIIAPIDFLRTR